MNAATNMSLEEECELQILRVQSADILISAL